DMALLVRASGRPQPIARPCAFRAGRPTNDGVVILGSSLQAGAVLSRVGIGQRCGSQLHLRGDQRPKCRDKQYHRLAGVPPATASWTLAHQQLWSGLMSALERCRNGLTANM